MASRWTWNVVDQQVARALEDDQGKELDQLYYALRSRTVLLYLMFHLRELIMLARAIRFWLVVIALILIVSLFSTWVIRFEGTITPT
jgi:hypothetical protein